MYYGLRAFPTSLIAEPRYEARHNLGPSAPPSRSASRAGGQQSSTCTNAEPGCPDDLHPLPILASRFRSFEQRALRLSHHHTPRSALITAPGDRRQWGQHIEYAIIAAALSGNGGYHLGGTRRDERLRRFVHRSIQRWFAQYQDVAAIKLISL